MYSQIHLNRSSIQSPYKRDNIMISTKLTTTNNGVLAHKFIPEPVRGLVERRTADNKIFGKLEISAPNIVDGMPEETDIIIAGFLLDNSESMAGTKLQYAINTIRKFVEVIHSERNGKTIETRQIHAWIYLITFNSKATVVIPLQEITDDTLPTINALLDEIRAEGCTNYEAGFKKQAQVLEEIIQNIREPTTILRFFETDGEITQGTHDINKLYKMMRSTTSTAADPDTTTNPQRTPPCIVFEDYVLGYGKDVDLGCLKALASPYPPSEEPHATSTDIIQPTSTAVVGGRQRTPQYNNNWLVIILKPEEIGWRVGEILSKFIMRYGFKFQVSISTASENQGTIELFEYQTHQWGSSTIIHSMMYGEKRSLWVQYTPPSPPQSATASPAIHVTVRYEIPKTGKEYTYTFEHQIELTTPAPSPASIAEPFESTIPFQQVMSLILGMIQIETLKQYREIEANRIDMDTIVREAYKTLRMLYSIDAVTRISFPHIACQTANLLNDVKVIIGLTTIGNFKEQQLVIHARRVCSAEQELFNSGATVSRKYVDSEEEYEHEATRIIEEAKARRRQERQQHAIGIGAADAAAQAQPAYDDDDNNYDDDDEYEEADDALPSRIPTVMPRYSQQIDTPYVHDRGGNRFNRRNGGGGGSELRTLCVKIAMARNKKEDITSEQIYENMYRSRQYQYYEHQDYEYDNAQNHGGLYDDTFSSTPMDEYTQRRMGMMRQMSS